MHSTAFETNDGVLWIIIILVTYVQIYACMISSSQWEQTTGVSYLVCADEAISTSHAYSVSHCAGQCSMETTCAAFTYVPTSGTNCYIMATDPPYNTPNCVTTASAKHFSKPTNNTVLPFPCHLDDGQYHTYLLSDGTSFSYRIVQSTFVNMETARADCVSTDNGFLAKLNSVARIAMMQELMLRCPGFGLNYYYVDGSNSDAADYHAEDAWKWSDGKTIARNTTFWGSGKPNFEHSEHCIVIGSNSEWKLNDADCGMMIYYICEKQ